MSAPLFAARDLKVHFPVRGGILNKVVGKVKAVDGVSLHINRGETLSLVGESGCGKSTIGNAILGLSPITQGTVEIDGVQRKAGSRVHLGEMQVISQDTASALNPRMRIGKCVEEPLRAAGVPAEERRARAIELLSLVGFKPEIYSRYPNEVSGGQRQRVVIARALALKPKLLVCDEPISALDVSIRAQILNLLVDLQKKLDVAYLFISHDMSTVRYISDRVAVMYLGRIMEQGPTEKLFENPQHPYTRALLSAVPLADPDRQREREKIILRGELPSPLNPPAGCGFVNRCPLKVSRCETTRPELISVGDEQSLACLRWRELATEYRDIDVPQAGS